MSSRTIVFFLACVAATATALADGGVQPKELLDPSRPEAREQLRPNADTGDQLALDFDAAGFTMTLSAGPAGYPGAILSPADGAPSWDCSLYGHIEAKITNLGDRQEIVNLRVDNASTPENRNPWNAEMLRIDPGKTQAIRVFFGYSYYFQKSYPLDPSAIVRLLFFTGKLDHEAKFRIEGVQAAGWQGEKPGENPDQARLKPRDGWVFGPSRPAQGAVALQTSNGATAATTPDGVAVRLPAAGKPAATVKPVRGFWDFSEHMQVRLRVRNDGAAPAAPRFHLTSIDGTSAEVSPAPIAPGAEADVVLPFAPEKPWTAPTDPAQSEILKGGGWDRLPGTGTAYRSQKTRGLEIRPDTAAGAETALTILSLRAENPPAVRPAWLGTRPPVPGRWKQTLKQEFDGPALDDRLFNVYWFNWWDKRQHDSKDNVFLRDGKLVLRTEKKRGWHNDNPDPAAAMPGSLGEKQGHSLETDYATGWVDSYGKWTQRYGYFEVRCKLPTQPCLWPAVWFCPDSGLERYPRGLPRLDWNQFKYRSSTFGGGMEIDMVEAQSSWGPHRFNTACHWDGYGKEHKKLGTSANYIPTDPDGFLTVGMLWLPGSLSFYGNGELFWTWESPRVCDEPVFFEIQNQLGGWDNDPLDDSLLPADFEIDYIRVWQRDDLASSDDGPKPNEGGLDGRVGPGLPGPGKPDPRNDRLRKALELVDGPSAAKAD